MRIRRLAVAAVAALAVFPSSGAIAASSTTDLRDALADPLESGFTEQTFANPNVIVGYFDAALFSNWLGNDATQRQYFRNLLVGNGFVTGYQRFWYMTRSSDTMYETVFVFKDSAGADSLHETLRSQWSGAADVKSWVPVQLNDSAFAVQEINSSEQNYHWTIVEFTKANDLFEMSRGSTSDFQTAAAVAQAREMYTVAPNGTAVGPQSTVPHQSPLVQLRIPLIITFVAGAMLIAIALVIAVVSTLTVRPAQAASRP